MENPSLVELLGAGGLGFVIGWYVYFTNRYRKSDAQLSDTVSVIGAIVRASVTALFPAKSELFGAYGIGLFAVFFWYFMALLILVSRSQNFDADWFLDGRRKKPQDPYYIPEGVAPTIRPMGQTDRGPNG